MPAMSMTDEGQPVNHHLEAHIYDKASGKVLNNVMPRITITNQAKGASRPLSPVMAMYGIQEGQSDFHYGGNVYLPPGTYAVAVSVNGQTATFKDLAVSGAAAPMSMPSAMPRTGGGGGSPDRAPVWLFGVGLAGAACAGFVLRRHRARH